jgi:UDP-GlcNAc:undecaprenyl-phosphate GlcNAc-1-phosphate transferase
VAFLINAMNLFDGLDGLAAGTAMVAAAGFLLLAEPQASFSTILGFSVIGCCAGLLTQNLPPARIFMGDSGSTLLGLSLAFLGLDWIRTDPQNHNLALPLVLLGLPVTDALLAIIRRIRALRSPFTGDRRHLYDLVLQRGWTLCAIMLASMGVTGALVITALASQKEQRAPQALAGMLIVFLVAAHFLGSLKPERRTVRSEQAITPAYMKTGRCLNSAGAND